MNDLEGYPNQKYGWVKENNGSWSLYTPDGTKVIGSAGNTVQVPSPVGATDAATKAYADSSGGGGGSTTFSGVRVSLGADADWGGGGTLPFDHVSVDTDGYWDAVNHKAVIPAGKAGMYRASFQLYVAANAAITSGLVILEANDPDPVLGGGFDFPFVKYAHNGIWLAWGTADVYGHEADNIFLDGGMFGVDPSTVSAGCFFGLTYLGPTDSVPT